jgi:hypothetical protein
MHRVTVLVPEEDAPAANALAEACAGPEAAATFGVRVLDAQDRPWRVADLVADEPLRLAMLTALAAVQTPIRWAIVDETSGRHMSDSEPGAEARVGRPWSWAHTRALMALREEGL